MKEFQKKILLMNEMYRLPINTEPTMPSDAIERLKKFKKTLLDEVDEIDEIIEDIENSKENEDVMVSIADLLSDIMVYCASEAQKYGIDIDMTLGHVMDSNESKLDENGNPIYDENGKFLKGPNYWKPEPRIYKSMFDGGKKVTVSDEGWVKK